MLRAFTDSSGIEWRVWDVLPSAGSSDATADGLSASLQDTAFANGWLCFESPVGKRRLAPIPRGWESRETQHLERLREQATPVPLRQQHWRGVA
jgi:hypothetical protein